VINSTSKFIPKIKIKHLFALILMLLPIVLIGISNYLFAPTSFHFFADPENPQIITRQWVGDIDGIYMTIILSAVVTVLWLTILIAGKLDNFMTNLPKFIKNLINIIKNNPNKVAVHLAVLIYIIIIAITIVSITVDGGSKLSWARQARTLFFISIGMCGYFIVLFHKDVEKLFLLLSLTIGSIFILAHPHYWYSWDNAIHYAYAFEESFVRYASPNQADIALVNKQPIPYGRTPAFDGYPQLMSGDELATVRQYKLGTHTLAVHSTDVNPLLVRLAHMPAGIMLFIGRSLALAPLAIMRLGLLGNHLVYTVIVYFAIKRLNSGKHIMAIIAMFPTAFVLSTTFSYDYWLTALAMLGFAYYFNEVQNPDEKIKIKNIIILIGSFAIGMAPKAAYFLLMAVLYFIKRNKFKTTKGYCFYLFAVTCGIFIVLSSYLLPLLSDGIGTGDMRGGEEINAAIQIDFILNNPLAYTLILLNYFREYFNVFAVSNYVTQFAWLGFASFLHLTWLLLIFTMLTDRNEKDLITGKAGFKVILSFITFGTIVLFTTAMYIVFTPVGADTIQGVQSRYMIPVLFPILYALGSFRLKININKTAYTSGIFGVMSLVLLNAALDKLILV